MAGFDSFMYSKEYQDDLSSGFAVRNIPARRLPPRDLPVKPFLVQPVVEEDDTNEEYRAAVRRYVEIAVSLATLITENLLSHPMVVLRRQCQVQPGSRRWHMTPFTLVPVIVRLHQRQGLSTLWKGLGSCLLVRGMVLAAEDSLSKFTPWPKEITVDCTVKSFGQHLLLKGISLALVTPFYSASLVETVQSDIASEKPGLTDVIREGLCRVVTVGAARGRMLPVWALVGPTVAHGLLKYLVALGVKSAATWTIHMQIRADQARRGAVHKHLDSEENLQHVEVTASFIAMVTAEVVCYPLETILHRLHLQGTRTIVDQLDSGTEVVPILTAYSGAADCYADAVACEGFGGLYRGFGALLMQVAVHWAVIRLTRFVVARGAALLRPPPHPRLPPPMVPPAPLAGGDWRPSSMAPHEPVGGADWRSTSMAHREPFAGADWRPSVTSTPTTTPMTEYIPRRPDSQ